jgi:excisionase family DNA binding protein
VTVDDSFPIEQPGSFSTSYVAQRLGVSIPTVQRWVDSGHLKAWKTVGGHRRIDAESAELMFRAHGLHGSQGRPSAAATKAADGPIRVLVVDDNPDDRDVLSALVEAALPEAAVAVAENGFEALLEIGKSSPDVVITDVAMPHMDGFEMLRHLSMVSPQKARAILVVSGQTRAQFERLGSLPSEVTFLPKPIDQARFTELLHAAALAIRVARG